MPMSVRTPEESISIRLTIGWVKMLLHPAPAARGPSRRPRGRPWAAGASAEDHLLAEGFVQFGA